MELQTVDRGRQSEREDLPTNSELKCLRQGNFVRVGLTSGERFWCMLISGRRPNGTYAAVVESKPATDQAVKRGDVVILEKSHVFEII